MHRYRMMELTPLAKSSSVFLPFEAWEEQKEPQQGQVRSELRATKLCVPGAWMESPTNLFSYSLWMCGFGMSRVHSFSFPVWVLRSWLGSRKKQIYWGCCNLSWPRSPRNTQYMVATDLQKKIVWPWVKKKPPGDHRFWSIFPLAIGFLAPFFHPKPISLLWIARGHGSTKPFSLQVLCIRSESSGSWMCMDVWCAHVCFVGLLG